MVRHLTAKFLNFSLLKTLIFIILGPGTITVLIPYTLLSYGAEFSLNGFRLIGVFPIAFGAVIDLRCAWDFAITGRGTPAPIDPPKVLVSKGLYRLVRNPMYIGIGLVLLGEAILFASWILFSYALIVLIVAHLFVIFYEEPTLKRKFGTAYEDYTKAVQRWIPRIRGRQVI